jgi:predicted DNA-binding transcriptional regulator AlpA
MEGHMPSRKFLFKSEVVERTGQSFGTIWLQMRQEPPAFPLAVAVGGRTAWYEDEVDKWINSRPVKQYKPMPKRKQKKSAAA